MVGGPPQQDMYDYKPVMDDWYDKELPESIRNGQRLTTMTSGQKRFPIAPSKFKFKQQSKRIFSIHGYPSINGLVRVDLDAQRVPTMIIADIIIYKQAKVC